MVMVLRGVLATILGLLSGAAWRADAGSPLPVEVVRIEFGTFPALREDKTLAEWAKHFGLHPTQIVQWNRRLLEHAAEAFGGGAQAAEPVDLAPLHATWASRPWSSIF